jgi:hypothetical protein
MIIQSGIALAKEEDKLLLSAATTNFQSTNFIATLLLH